MRHLALFAIILLLASCKKKDDEIKYEIRVTVTDYYSDAPVSSASVQGYTKGINSGTYSNTFQLAANETTSSAGIVTLSIPYGGLEVIKITIAKDGFFGKSEEYNPDNLSTENTNDVAIQIKQKGVVSFNIKNTSPTNTSDEITFNTINPDCDECVKFSSLNFIGMNVDTTLVGTVVLNRYYKYQYIVTKNGNPVNYLDSAFCSSDTTFINLNY